METNTETNIETKWTSFAETLLVGRTITTVRYLTADEARGLGWYERPLVLELDDGTLLFPSRDAEGNDGGSLFGQSLNGAPLTFPSLSR